jgi:CelD/BcsL family acetyltransferase involved in cellulose biosynthesis
VSLEPSIEAELLDTDSPRWTGALSRMRHDIYHLPAYVRFAARRQEVGEPHAFVAEHAGQRFFVPLIIRAIPPDVSGDGPGWFDATCPRGYPGPLVEADGPAMTDSFVDEAIRALRHLLRERGVVSAYIRMHPLLTPAVSAFARAGAVADRGTSTAIDLTLSHDELWRQTNHGHRLGISKARRRGYVARIDESWERFDGFVAVYQATMDRLGAVPFWRFSAEYFRDLRDTLGERLHLCVVEVDGELAAAGLLTELDGIVEFHLSGTADAHLEASPSKLLIDYARWWAQERGNDWFHLTGSVRPGDALSQFKAGFSPLTFPVRSWHLVSDPETYDELVARTAAVHGVASKDDWFPAYRVPGVSAS